MSKMYSIGDLALTLTRALPKELTLTQAHARAKKELVFFRVFRKKTSNFYKNSLLQQNLFKVR